jgi:hypothetical protein
MASKSLKLYSDEFLWKKHVFTGRKWHTDRIPIFESQNTFRITLKEHNRYENGKCVLWTSKIFDTCDKNCLLVWHLDVSVLSFQKCKLCDCGLKVIKKSYVRVLEPIKVTYCLWNLSLDNRMALCKQEICVLFVLACAVSVTSVTLSNTFPSWECVEVSSSSTLFNHQKKFGLRRILAHQL